VDLLQDAIAIADMARAAEVWVRLRKLGNRLAGLGSPAADQVAAHHLHDLIADQINTLSAAQKDALLVLLACDRFDEMGEIRGH
jgi:N12 class adenine-specific DNA methylase